MDITDFETAVESIVNNIKVGTIDDFRFLSALSSDQRKKIYDICELNGIVFERKGTRYKVVYIFKKKNVDNRLDDVGEILKRMATIALTRDPHVDEVVNSEIETVPKKN